MVTVHDWCHFFFVFVALFFLASQSASEQAEARLQASRVALISVPGVVLGCSDRARSGVHHYIIGRGWRFLLRLRLGLVCSLLV